VTTLRGYVEGNRVLVVNRDSVYHGNVGRVDSMQPDGNAVYVRFPDRPIPVMFLSHELVRA
jgi:hypothetical protein